MTVTITQRHNEARLAGTLADLQAGAGSPAVCIYGGSRPASPSDAPGSTLLVRIELARPAGVISAGLLSLQQLEDSMVLSSGVPTWARFVDGNGSACFDCDAGSTPGAEVQLAPSNLYAGGYARLVEAVLG